KSGHHQAGLQIPDLGRPILARGGDVAAVRAERHARDPGLVLAQDTELVAGGGVPDPDRTVTAAGGDVAASGAIRHTPEAPGASAEGAHYLAGRRVPDLHRTVGAGGGDAAAVGTVRHAPDACGVAFQVEQVRMALLIEEVPLPAPLPGWALVEQGRGAVQRV